MEKRVKHLEFIQGVVNRLSANSFLLKGWSVVLVSALFALSASDSGRSFAFLAFIPAFGFWGLDGLYVRQEWLFRALYNHVRTLAEDQVDFSMDTAPFRATAPSWLNATFSKTLLPFHGVLILAILLVMYIGRR